MKQPKTAVYMATKTKNWYEKVQPSINSMLANSPSIDRVVILCEDDVFPYPLPNKVETMNVSKQTFFRSDSPNMLYNRWSYMVLMRAALSKLFPDLDKVLSIDADTIVCKDLGSLWEMDMSEYYVAGVKEPEKTRIYDRIYINAGVTFWNLDLMRKEKADDLYIERLNIKNYLYLEQDCLNEMFQGRIKTIGGHYNTTPYTEQPEEEIVIRHFAADSRWYEENRFVKQWKKAWE